MGTIQPAPSRANVETCFRDLLDRVPVSRGARVELARMMGHGDRHYHGIAHLATLWERHRRYASDAGFAIARFEGRIACAIAYHDCIYVGGGRDNEELSAEAWLDASRDSAMSASDRLWVADTIRATADHLAFPPDGAAPASDADAACIWVLDLDLTPLGEAPDGFDRNTELLRLEMPHLSLADYDRGRLAFLRRFDTVPAIYRSPVLANAFENAARANIARQFA